DTQCMDGDRSLLPMPAMRQRQVSRMVSIIPAAAISRDKSMLLCSAILPQVRLPNDIEPMKVIMNKARPRARTQLGRASWAATCKVDNTVIQAKPLAAVTRHSQ